MAFQYPRPHTFSASALVGSESMAAITIENDRLAPLLHWALEHLDEPLTIHQLAAHRRRSTAASSGSQRPDGCSAGGRDLGISPPARRESRTRAGGGEPEQHDAAQKGV